MTPILHAFPFSNFCEKARWALDCSGVDYEDRVYWPGLHAKKITALSGQTAVPVLEVGDRIIVGSAAINKRDKFTALRAAYSALSRSREAMALENCEADSNLKSHTMMPSTLRPVSTSSSATPR